MNRSPTKIEGMLFDLDGTLVDTAADFVITLNNQRQKHGFPEIDEAIIRNTVSNGARALTKLAFGGEEGEPEFEAYRQELLDDYIQIVGEHASLFDGMDEILSLCDKQNIPWGIITNKPRRFTEKLLAKLNLNSNCAITLCADDVTRPKPHPESMLKAGEHLGINLNNTVYVGDHARDIEAGNAANMITVAASYGYISDKSEANSWSAQYVIDHPITLKQLFLA